ncbi:MAG: hypothetical protein OHK0047_14610 [Leptolyngbyaceae cyanobacterium]|uniref:hypothetical protein n=2 Tax=Leptodesmis TaxID=2664261 RepID=UPI001F1CFCD2|nr:hypothetical protein [Leptodesmis sichuanensis]UIE38445.1 hypothetical protein KIK02_01950 [Leptodesmis sichuanensis A121]
MNGVICKAAPLSILLAVCTFTSAPVQAQTSSTDRSECMQKAIDSSNPAQQIIALGRAVNLARQAAEAANGGLSKYQADASMHGPASIAPCVDNGDGTWTFTVKGGKPGFTTPTQETIVNVDGNTWKVSIVSNGPIR